MVVVSVIVTRVSYQMTVHVAKRKYFKRVQIKMVVVSVIVTRVSYQMTVHVAKRKYFYQGCETEGTW